MTDTRETRPWRNDDLEALRTSESLFAPATYPQRFVAGGRRLRPLHARVAEHLASSGHRWMGHVATDGDRLVVLAECAWDPADLDSPTLTVNVADDWQRGDLGRVTLRELVRRCLLLGLATFTVDFAGSNVPLESLMETIAAETGARYSPASATPAGLGRVTVRTAK